MNKIQRFEKFLVEKENIDSRHFTQKDIDNVSDLFLEIADEYKMTEWFKGIKKRSKIYYKVGINMNPYFLDLSINIMNPHETNTNEIIKKIKKDFIPRLKKWGYNLVGVMRIEEDEWILIDGYVEMSLLINYTFHKIKTQLS